MSVRCPSCATVPLLSAADIAAAGTMVRCARCGTRWVARLPADDTYGAPGLLPGLHAVDISDAVVIEENAPRRIRRLPPPVSVAAAPPRRSTAIDHRLKALGIIFGVVASFVFLRAPIVAALPGLGRLPAEVNHLEFRKVRSETVHLGATSTLFVEGEIVNRSSDDVALPAIRITLKSPEGEVVSSWLVEPSVDGLAAGRSIGFRSALAAPPTDATQVSLRLAVREGLTAALE